MCKVILEKILIEYLLYLVNNEKNQYIDDIDESIIDLDNIRNIIVSSKQEKENYVHFEIYNLNKTRLMQYVLDKQLEIGFINEDYLNEEGKNLQRIYDEIYYQTN